MSEETTTWDSTFVQQIQEILDRSAATATPEVGAVFARPDWRLDAETFLNTWKSVNFCTIMSVGPKGQPHSAVVHAEFSDGLLKTGVFENSVRAQDLRTNSRVALSKHTPDGTVMTIYGRARRIDGTRRELNTAGGGGRAVWSYAVDVTRIYAMKPKRG